MFPLRENTLSQYDLQVWDLIILIPNLAFLLFLFYKLPSTRLKLRATNSELFRSLYSIVLTCSLASALRYLPEQTKTLLLALRSNLTRCLLSMMLHLDSVEHDLANKGVWVTTRFLLLTAELSVVAFGCAFGVRENKVCESSMVSKHFPKFSCRSAFRGSLWYVLPSLSWCAPSRLTLRSFSLSMASRWFFLQHLTPNKTKTEGFFSPG